jgi:hypothetical protein
VDPELARVLRDTIEDVCAALRGEVAPWMPRCRICGYQREGEWDMNWVEHPVRPGIWYCHRCLVQHPALGRFIRSLSIKQSSSSF